MSTLKKAGAAGAVICLPPGLLSSRGKDSGPPPRWTPSGPEGPSRTATAKPTSSARSRRGEIHPAAVQRSPRQEPAEVRQCHCALHQGSCLRQGIRCLHLVFLQRGLCWVLSFFHCCSAQSWRSSRRLRRADEWTKAQGRVVKGLVNRRTAERKLCLEGIGEPANVPVVKPTASPKKPAPPTPPTFWERIKLVFTYVWKGL
jgi:hypothetical protein